MTTNNEDYDAKMEEFKKILVEAALLLAEQGNASSQRMLGQYCAAGIGGLEQNLFLAAEWYLKAAEQGEPEAQFELSLLYTTGHGVDADYTQAMHWLQKSAEQGYEEAQAHLRTLDDYQNSNLPYIFGRPLDEAAAQNDTFVAGNKMYQRLVEMGHGAILETIRYIFETQVGELTGVSSDETAFQYNIPSASTIETAQGSTSVKWQSSAMPPVDAEALNNVQAAIMECIGEYQFQAAQAYLLNQDTGPDYTKAVEYCRKAIDHGHERALRLLAGLGLNGCAEAQFAMGELCATDGGMLNKCILHARRWYTQAAEQGHEGARKALETLGPDETEDEL